jgi:hypothetical protein
VFDTAYGRLGAAICWDQWFPETARAMALQGAEVRGRLAAGAAHDPMSIMVLGVAWRSSGGDVVAGTIASL